MPIAFQIFPEYRFFATRYFADVDDEDFISTYQKIIADQETRAGFNELLMVEPDTHFKISKDAYDKIVQVAINFNGQANRKMLTAIVISNLTHELVTDYYSTLSAFADNAVESVTQFTCLSDALVYLGIDHEQIEFLNLQQSEITYELTQYSQQMKSIRAVVDDKTLKLVEKNKQLARLATTDYLTGLANRSHIDSIVASEFEQFARYGHPTCLALVDIDHFKSTNDSYGHLTGDRVLTEFALVLKMSMRSFDLAGRWGGDEFMLLFRETSLEKVSHLLERIRTRIESYDFGLDASVTTSIGVAEFSTDVEAEELFARADAALYEAKNHGRNCIKIYK